MREGAQFYLRMKKELLLLCSLLLFSCSNELNQSNQNETTMEISTEGTSLLVANAFFDSVKKTSVTRSLNASVYPDYYGGCYMSDEGKTIFKVVAGCTARAKNDIESRTKSSNFNIEECEFSYNAMQNVLQKLDDKFFSSSFTPPKKKELNLVG